VVRASANTRSSHTSAASIVSAGTPVRGARLIGASSYRRVSVCQRGVSAATDRPLIAGVTRLAPAVFIAFSPLRGWLGQ
jgi:hypothetical protein